MHKAPEDCRSVESLKKVSTYKVSTHHSSGAHSHHRSPLFTLDIHPEFHPGFHPAQDLLAAAEVVDLLKEVLEHVEPGSEAEGEPLAEELAGRCEVMLPRLMKVIERVQDEELLNVALQVCAPLQHVLHLAWSLHLRLARHAWLNSPVHSLKGRVTLCMDTRQCCHDS